MKNGLANKEELRNALDSIEKALATIEIEVKSGSCADFARLIQMRRDLLAELEQESTKEIKVTWVEPDLESVAER